MEKFDICIIGSGAGASPIAYEAALAGKKVIVLEKGPYLKTKDFRKDELVATRYSKYTSDLSKEGYEIETLSRGEWKTKSTFDTGRDFWNGNMVGGSSNLMSGYFHRMKPNDFNLLSKYGEIEGANIVDWPINYQELEPYYEKVERIVGVSGRVTETKFQEPRSTNDFPYPALAENKIVAHIDAATKKLGYDTIPIPRAIISTPEKDRNSCYYSGYCGSYGCSSDAKSSGRVSLLEKVKDRITLLDHAKVYHIETNGKHQAIKAWYTDNAGEKKFVEATVFVVACQAVESARLLLNSTNSEFPNGIGNNNQQLGKNLLFSAGGVGYGYLNYSDFSDQDVQAFKQTGLFVNRSINEFYEIDDFNGTGNTVKGGLVDFLWEHNNAMTKAMKIRKGNHGSILRGEDFRAQMKKYFVDQRRLNFEVFCDWLPTDNCYVELSKNVKDYQGIPVAKMRLGYHQHDLEVGRYLADKGEKVLKEMGLSDIYSGISGGAPPNLQAGGCRFGNDPKTSVLDKNCKVHDADNVYVTDGSFMPTGGSVTYTWTIYANAFRVADVIKNVLG